MDATAALQLISLAISVFGQAAPIVTQVVKEIEAQSGMTVEQLLESAEQTDAETRTAIEAHIAAAKAAKAGATGGGVAAPTEG